MGCRVITFTQLATCPSARLDAEHWIPEHKTAECLSAGRGRKMPDPGACQGCETKLTGRTLGGRKKRRCSMHDLAAEMFTELRAALLNSDYVNQKYGLSRSQCDRIRVVIEKTEGKR